MITLETFNYKAKLQDIQLNCMYFNKNNLS
jgi:hypothetical protein